MEKIIIVNSGSASKKYALYEDRNLVVAFHFEKNDKDDSYILHQKKNNDFDQEFKIENEEYENAFDFFIDWLIKNSYINSETDLKVAAFRIVAPGNFFTFDRIIDENFLLKLDEIHEDSPLHISKMKEEFNQVLNRLPKIKLLGISDSRFHKTIPEYASIYALPEKIREELEIKKFGYHGISISSVIDKIKKDKNHLPEKIIICHLGGGSSVNAVKNGESIDTTMGYSPLDGLPMSTRVGHIDPGAIISISNRLDLDMNEMRDIFYYKSGLKGISGQYDDIRNLIEAVENRGDEKAKIALDHFIYEIKKSIGSFYAILGGLDLLVFTGTISERSYRIRRMICENLEHLGLELDEKNNLNLDFEEGYINKPGSLVSIEVIHTQEFDEMAKRAFDLL